MRILALIPVLAACGPGYVEDIGGSCVAEVARYRAQEHFGFVPNAGIFDAELSDIEPNICKVGTSCNQWGTIYVARGLGNQETCAAILHELAHSAAKELGDDTWDRDHKNDYSWVDGMCQDVPCLN